jgi:uncharacterized protein
VNRVFVDTSGVYALMVASDSSHDRAAGAFRNLEQRRAPLTTTSYVLIESYALLGRRVGLEAAEAFRSDFPPLLEVVWVDQSLHERGLDLLFEKRLQDLSLVDAVSFVTMRDQDIEEVFAYDSYFEQEGFSLVD